MLHQATERLYQCLFLVRTLYTPKTHNLNRLRQLAEEMEPSLKQVWPGLRVTKSAHTHDCAKPISRLDTRANIASRATSSNGSERRVELFKTLVERACLARLETLEKAA